MNKILTLLRSPGAMLGALVLALVAQLEHTARVFSMVVNAQGWGAQAHAYAFAAAVEVAVLLFVLAGHRRISYGFAIATALTNLSYYAMHDVALLTVAGAPAWLMSLLLPAAIVGYSHTIADAPRPQDDADAAVAPSMSAPDDALPNAVQPSARAIALQMAEEGCTVTQIAAQVDAKPTTVRSWITRERAKRNGSTHIA